MQMYEKHLVMISVFIIIISLFSFSVKSYDVSDPSYTNEIIDKIDTPSIEPGDDGDMTIILKNPYDNSSMEDINFTVSIYWYSYLDVDKNISEVDEPPVFDNGETYSALEIENLSSNESEDLEYVIHISEETEEGIYSIRFRLEFSMDGENETLKSREDLPESTLEVRDPVPRWPQYALGIITIISGVLAVMFYMQEKYGSFPQLEKAFDNWTGKLKEFRSGLKERFKNF
ncbi:MAG: hypothetical protein V5A66_00345 [Candidatus Thermoplasmatota archaeon]